ncbi:hypothetical protein [Celeribacter sp. PS-C1]|uniref:hypothetical protein n=1 Tax=Celeribacter sp. PS-C1 TaxID=2820813 RepID=UPI001CA4F090|nr:hypothetical protein [Celeribacter sp. PS-C1]MBW6419728.1 hypothetical protein [Celeribacter sp. PS-C1]
MIYEKPSRLMGANLFGAIQHERYTDTCFALSGADLRGMEHLLLRRGPDGARLSPLLNGLIRKKIRMSCELSSPLPKDIAASGRLVTYVVEGESTRSGVLSMSTMPLNGTIPVGSLLGATLIGATRGQKIALLHEDGEIGAVTLLEIHLLNDGPLTA